MRAADAGRGSGGGAGGDPLVHLSPMGQTIAVQVKPGASPEVRVFEANRSITGMALESFESLEAAERRENPSNVLARRLFGLGAKSVTVYSSTVTVRAAAAAWAAMEPKAVEAIERLFEYYGESAGYSPENLTSIGVTPKPILA